MTSCLPAVDSSSKASPSTTVSVALACPAGGGAVAGGVSYCGETTKPSSSAGFAIPRSSFLVCSRALPVLSSACSNMVGDTLTTSPASPRPSTASSSTTSIRRLCALLGCGSSRYPSSLTFVAALRPLCLFSALAFDLRRASVFCRAKTSARATNGKRRSMRNVASGTRRRALPSTQQCTRMIARIIVARCRQSHSLSSHDRPRLAWCPVHTSSSVDGDLADLELRQNRILSTSSDAVDGPVSRLPTQRDTRDTHTGTSCEQRHQKCTPSCCSCRLHRLQASGCCKFTDSERIWTRLREHPKNPVHSLCARPRMK